MATRLKNILHFVVTPGLPVSIPHGLNVQNGRPVVPDVVEANAPGFTITADDTNVTVLGDGSVDVLVEAWHSIERVFGDVNVLALSPQPFILEAGGGGGGSGLCCDVVYRPDDPAGNHGNVFANWADAYAMLRETVEQISGGGGKVDLWYDGKYQDNVTIPVAGMPVGGWVMSDVIQRDAPHESVMFVTFEPGAVFTVDPDTTGNTPNALEIIGYGLGFVSDRMNPADPPPFTGINFRIGGSNVRFVNNDPASLPMFVYDPDADAQIEFSGECARGGLGYGGNPLPAPIVDVAGGTLTILTGAGLFGSNAFTDSVGGGTLVFQSSDDAFVGDFFNAFSNPAFEAAGGQYLQFNDAQPRWQIIGFFGSGPNFTVIAADSPAQAIYNQFVMVDSSTGPITIIAPTAGPAMGLRFSVKDVGNDAAANNITIAPTGADVIESPLISNDGGCKTWASNGFGNWYLQAVV